MSSEVNVAIVGATGRIGSGIVAALLNSKNQRFVIALDHGLSVFYGGLISVYKITALVQPPLPTSRLSSASLNRRVKLCRQTYRAQGVN